MQKRAYFTIWSFLLTLFVCGFLHIVALNEDRQSSTQFSSPFSSSHDSIVQESDENTFSSSALSPQKYPPRAQLTPTGGIHSFFVASDQAFQTREIFRPFIILQSWFVIHANPKSSRLSGWKDSNLVFKSVAIQRT